MKTKMKPIAKEKLHFELFKKGFDIDETAQKMGLSTSVLYKNVMSIRTLAQLESMFDIKYEDIAPDKTPDVIEGSPTDTKQPFVDDGIPWLKLEYHISRAVAKGIKDSNLAEEIYQAIIKGFE